MATITKKCKNCAEIIKPYKNHRQVKRSFCSRYCWRISFKNSKNKHPLYSTYRSMLSRCNNKYATQYQNYGGRGIKVCDRWSNSFWSFLEDVGNKPSLTHTLDRIDNDGNYEPGNVRWATRKQQDNNRKKLTVANKSGYSGICFYKSRNRWRVYTGSGKTRIEHGYYKTLKEAIVVRKSVSGQSNL